MSQPENAEVIQGRLGWESGDVSEASPDELKPHPKNREIYGDTESADDLDDTFRESVAEKGVLEPLVITDGKQIISGHRRWLAAQEADLETVPVRYSEFDSELAEREALIEFNRQREKSDGQKLNEAEELLKIQRRRGRDRMSEGGKGGLEGSSERTNVDNHDSWEEVADVVGASSTGLKRGAEVKEKAESEEAPDPVRETAREQLDKLQSGESTFYKAAKEVKDKEAELAAAQQQEVETEYPATVRQQKATDLLAAVDQPDLVVTDPPYSTDLEDVETFAEGWLPAMLDAIGTDGQAFVFIGGYPEELYAYLKVLSDCGAIDRAHLRIWNYKNTTGKAPKYKYRQNWQTVLFIQSDPPTELDAPRKSELSGVQEFNQPHEFGDVEPSRHKWQKPRDILGQMIRHASEPEDLVVDPFVGSGSTVLEAAELGRRALGGDIDQEALETAVDRGCVWEDEQ